MLSTGELKTMPPPSPPGEFDSDYASAEILLTGSRVLKAQAAALGALSERLVASTLAQSSNQAQAPSHYQDGTGFVQSLLLLRNCVLLNSGKIVITGMGKSYKIAGKLVATLQSFGIPAAALHPCDALHGDLGNVKATDALVMITASGSTPELRQLLPHLPLGLDTVCITCETDSPLARLSGGVISAAVSRENSEETIYGLAAPTVTTTACLAVGDAMCIALHELLERDIKQRRANFLRWHPGGAIGMANHHEEIMMFDGQTPQFIEPLDVVPEIDLWRACASCRVIIANGWVFPSQTVVDTLKQGSRLIPSSGQKLEHIRRLSLSDAQKLSGLSVVVENGREVGLLLH